MTPVIEARTPADRTWGPRERVVYSAAQLIRRDGVSGTGLREIVADAGAPRGSLQHYFPGGKDQVVDEALAWSSGYAAAQVESYLATAAAPTPSGLFAALVAQWRADLRRYDYARGCPLVAATADLAAGHEAIRSSIDRGFATWQKPITTALRRLGVPRTRAASLSLLMLSALEGAIIIARARRSPAPLNAVVRELAPLLDAAVAPA